MSLHTATAVDAPAPVESSRDHQTVDNSMAPMVRDPSLTSITHPLAISLEQGNIKLIDEEHNIADRPRTNIDEDKEVEDAELLLRRNEIRKLKGNSQTLVSARDEMQHERDELQRSLEQSHYDLSKAREQINLHVAHTKALQQRIESLEAMLRQQSLSPDDLHRQIDDLFKEMLHLRVSEKVGIRDQNDGYYYAGDTGSVSLGAVEENALLHERIHFQDFEIHRLKGEAMGIGREAVSLNWQASVDAAVRIKREQDATFIKYLLDENERLRSDRHIGVRET